MGSNSVTRPQFCLACVESGFFHLCLSLNKDQALLCLKSVPPTDIYKTSTRVILSSLFPAMSLGFVDHRIKLPDFLVHRSPLFRQHILGTLQEFVFLGLHIVLVDNFEPKRVILLFRADIWILRYLYGFLALVLTRLLGEDDPSSLGCFGIVVGKKWVGIDFIGNFGFVGVLKVEIVELAFVVRV
ncbi:hypothetical protein Tco_0924292 [Tanacetum coccineum]|uniref:Uncharacterized protein n=1 Tax=Tanacetum coccineum TaxID=301880 RepID=A0ABQ5D5M2_9ASTR